MKFWKIAFLFCLMFLCGHQLKAATNTFVALTIGSGAPVGNCTSVYIMYLDTTTGNLYPCKSAGSPWTLTGTSSIYTVTGQLVVPLGSFNVPSIGVIGSPSSGGFLQEGLYFIASGVVPVGAVCFVDFVVAEGGAQVDGCLDDEGLRMGDTGAIRFTSGNVQSFTAFNNGGITTANTNDGTLNACNGQCADNNANGSFNMTNLFTTGKLRSNPRFFSAVPTCVAGTEGDMSAVKDSTTNTWGATVTGGGALHILAYCDGTNWTVMGK